MKQINIISYILVWDKTHLPTMVHTAAAELQVPNSVHVTVSSPEKV
jgi:hypothetical protein